MNTQAVDPSMVKALEGASNLQLYQLKSFIDGLLADPRRGIAARAKLHLGRERPAGTSRPAQPEVVLISSVASPLS